MDDHNNVEAAWTVPGALAGSPDMMDLAARPAMSAQSQGGELTGENGLFTKSSGHVLRSALETEMSHHLGYERHDPMGCGGENSRNGTTPKRVATDVGKVLVQALPVTAPGRSGRRSCGKRQRRPAGSGQAVISLYAKGLTTSDTADHLAEVDDTAVSRGLVSKAAYSGRTIQPARLSSEDDLGGKAASPLS